jgi:hypothetical protein
MAKSTAAIEIEVTPKGGATETVKTFKQQLKEAKNEAQQLVATFGEFSNEALAGQQRVANLSDQMEDFNDRVKALNPDKFSRVNTVVSGIASGFSAAQGAMALFGSESEDLQKQLVKVQGAMALSQGLEGLGKVQQQFTTLAKDTLKGVTKAFSTLKSAIISTGIGALVVGLGLLIAYWDDIKEALGGVSKEQTKVNAATRDAVAAQQGNIEKLKSYQKLVGDTSLSEKERKVALNELNKLGIETRDININSANSLSQLNARITDNINLIKQKAQAQALEKIIAEETEKIYREQNKTVDEQVEVLDELYAIDMAITTLDYEGAKVSRAKQKANENINKSQKLLNAATGEYDKILKGTVKTEAKVVDTTTQVNDAYEKQNSILQNKLNLQLIALDKSKALELSNLLLSERQKVEIENKYAQLSLKTKEDAIKKEQKIIGLITDPKQRLSQQRKLNEDLAKLDVDTINQKTSYNEKIKSLDDKQQENNIKNKDTYIQLQNEKFDEEAQRQIAFIKERDKYLEDKSKSEIQIAEIEIAALEKKYNTQLKLGKDDEKLSQEISDKKTSLHEKEIAQKQAIIDKENAIRDAKIKAASEAINVISSFNENEAQQASDMFNQRMEYLKQQGYSEEEITKMKDGELQKQDQRMKESFELNKNAQIASAVLNTYQAVSSALAMLPTQQLFPGQRFVEAGIALAAGLANVRKIQQTQYKSQIPTSNKIGNQSSGSGMQQMAAPRMSSLGNGNELTQDRRVYVTEGDISRTQKRVSNNQSVSVVE